MVRNLPMLQLDALILLRTNETKSWEPQFISTPHYKVRSPRLSFRHPKEDKLEHLVKTKFLSSEVVKEENLSSFQVYRSN